MFNEPGYVKSKGEKKRTQKQVIVISTTKSWQKRLTLIKGYRKNNVLLEGKCFHLKCVQHSMFQNYQVQVMQLMVGSTNTEIKIPSADIPELSHASLFYIWKTSECSSVCFANGQEFCLCNFAFLVLPPWWWVYHKQWYFLHKMRFGNYASPWSEHSLYQITHFCACMYLCQKIFLP